jgi:hypothetical protein
VHSNDAAFSLHCNATKCLLFPYIWRDTCLVGRRRHGGQNSDVRSNDVAFSLHCNVMTVVFLAQLLRYDRGGQRVSGACWAGCGAVAAVCMAYGAAAGAGAKGFTALGFLYLLSYVKLLATIVKFAPRFLETPSPPPQ